jgi:hypothetical protein
VASAFAALMLGGATAAHAQGYDSTRTTARADTSRTSYDEGTGTGFEVGLGGGVSFPTQTAFKNSFKTGWDLQAAFTITPSSIPFGVQIDGDFSQYTRKATGDKQKIYAGTANLIYKFKMSPDATVRPYVLGGGGIYNLKRNGSATPGGPGTTTKFGLNGGLGIDFKAGGVGFFVEGRFHDILFKSSATDPNAQNVAFINTTAGIRFGGK